MTGTTNGHAATSVDAVQHEAAPYTVEHVAAELESLYRYLITMYLPEDALRVPPAGGWPNITEERFSGFGKDPAVIDLLKHLPYIKDDGERVVFDISGYYQIYLRCVCNDYAGEVLQKDIVGRNSTSSWSQFPMDLPSHQFCLARISMPKDGTWIIFDTKTGEIERFDWMYGAEKTFKTISEFVQNMKDEFRDLKQVPFNPTRVFLGSKQDITVEIQQIYRDHGWPDAYNKEECLKATTKAFEKWSIRDAAEHEAFLEAI